MVFFGSCLLVAISTGSTVSGLFLGVCLLRLASVGRIRNIVGDQRRWAVGTGSDMGSFTLKAGLSLLILSWKGLRRREQYKRRC